jgi:DNA-binding response OmpR family regulator
MDKKRILIVDDDKNISELLNLYLIDAGFETFQSYDGSSALSFIKNNKVDLVLLDIMLPVIDGWEVCKLIRSTNSVPIIMLTARDMLEDKIRGFELGADDYVVKPFAVSELIARINAVLRRPGGALGMILSLGNVTYKTAERLVAIDEVVTRFSKRELALLELFLRRAERVVSKDIIENALYGFNEAATPNAIEVLTHRLRKKLIDKGANIEIHNLRGIGYVLQENSA